MSDKGRQNVAGGAWLLDAEDVQLIALGARVIGSGGGGDPYVGKLLALSALRSGLHVPIIPLDTLADDAPVIAVAQLGTVTVLAEKLATGDEVYCAFAALEHYLSAQAAAVLCYEIGGVNSMLPLTVAARRGLPLIDADVMGRAFPEVQMTMLDIHGAPSVPAVVCDDRGNVTIIAATQDVLWTERLARAMTVAMGGVAYLARPVARGADLKRVAIPGSYSRARALGAALREAQRARARGDEALAPLGGRLLVRGVITGVERRTSNGVSRGTAIVQDQNHALDGSYCIEFQNENLVVRRGAAVVATTPDVICVIDEETGEPADTEDLEARLHVAVVGFSAHAALTTPEALRSLGPGAFGYDVPYQPLALLT